MKQQARIQRAQVRMQMRAMRRGSIVGPLVLLTLGILFLLAQTGKVSWLHTLEWFGSWWPLVLIGAGLIVLAEWALDQHHYASDGTPRPRRVLGGGVIVLLVLLAVAGASVSASTKIYEHGMNGESDFFGRHFGMLEHLGNEHDSDDSLSTPVPAGANVIVRSPRGDVSVRATSTDGQVHVSVHKQTWAWEDSDAENKQRALQPVFSNEGTSLVLTVATVEGGQADLTVEIPQGTPLTLQADRGDVTVDGLNATVSLTANHGDVQLSDINGAVNAHVHDDSASISMQRLNGALLLEGHTGDVNLSDVTGAVTLQGDFFGTTHMERVNGPVRFESSRTQFALQRLDGELEIETGELQASDMMGPVTLTSRNKDITLNRVQGSVQIANGGKGDVSVTNAAPVGAIGIQNEHGSVDLGLPENASFVLAAEARRGDIEDDFGLLATGSDSAHTANGTVAHGGPSVSISTEGDVTVRKSTVQPLPPTPPAPPAAPNAAVAPTAPPAPNALHAPKAPAAPKPPPAPKAPASVSF